MTKEKEITLEPEQNNAWNKTIKIIEILLTIILIIAIITMIYKGYFNCTNVHVNQSTADQISYNIGLLKWKKNKRNNQNWHGKTK